MNNQQMQAALSVKRALKKAGEAGLTGGVFDKRFCLWPKSAGDMRDGDFFENVEVFGHILHVPQIDLDGGAGT